MNQTNPTIVALSTPTGVGAICIVRMSGKDAVKIADTVFSNIKKQSPSSFEPRKLELGTLKTTKFKEQILCVVFKAPFSFTGEDLVEFQCHGGTKIAEGVVETCIEHGAQMAQPGEFTKRAFLNGKINLSMAEGMMDMINAQSDAEIRAGFTLLEGELGKISKQSQEQLVDLLSNIEVSFDYPEEDIEYITKNQTEKTLKEIKTKLDDLIKTEKTGKQISNGVNLLILGEPNVGKSSLLNALTGTERAIVTPIAGTTRDTIEQMLEINGVKFNIIDTAGIHQTEDIVENIGINKAKEKIKSADLVLVLVDASKKQNEKDSEILNLTSKSNRIIVGNKMDLTSSPFQQADVYISTNNKKDIDNLKQLIYDKTINNQITNGVVITNLRHLDALKRASHHLDDALKSMQNSLDLISIDIKSAYSALGEITGNTTGEDIIDAIFSKFCLGK